MKICLVAHDYPPNVISGLGKYSENLVKGLIELGHEVTLVTEQLKGQSAYDEFPKLKIHRLKLMNIESADRLLPNIFDKRILFNRALTKFFSNFNVNQFDVLHNMDENNSYYLNNIPRPKVPIVTSLNAYYTISTSWNPFKFYDYNQDFIIKYPYYNIMKYRVRNAIKKADLLIANSEYTMQVTQEHSNLPKEKFRVVHRGINVEMFSTSVPENKYSNHSILFVGRNMERKGAIYLIKALKDIAQEFPDVHLTMIGLCSLLYRRKITSFLEENNLTKNVTFIDHRDSPELPVLYQQANVFCMPSLIEAFGQVILEAMSARTPVVGTQTGGIPEIISSDVGFCVPVKDSSALAIAIKEIFRDPKKAKLLGDAGHNRAQKFFNGKDMVSKTIKVYEEVCKST